MDNLRHGRGLDVSYVFEQKPDLDDLVHYGTKGMKWGVRKKPERTKREKASRAVQIAAIGGAIAVGAILIHSSGTRVSPNRPNAVSIRGAAEMNRILAQRDRSNQLAASLRGSRQNMTSAMRSSRTATQQAVRNSPGAATAARARAGQSTLRPNNDLATLRSAIARTVNAANADLRARDNALNIPFAQRTYIPAWD